MGQVLIAGRRLQAYRTMLLKANISSAFWYPSGSRLQNLTASVHVPATDLKRHSDNSTLFMFLNGRIMPAREKGTSAYLCSRPPLPSVDC